MASAWATRFAARSLGLLCLASAPACKTTKKPDTHAPITGAPSSLASSLPDAAKAERDDEAPKIRIAFHADPLPNLVYQLDCMIGRYPCSRAAYDDLWRRELSFDDDDQKKLDELRESRERSQGNLDRNDTPQGALSPLPLPRADRSPTARLAITSLVARTAEEHYERLSLLTTPDDARRTQDAIDHFRPRFDAYWERKGRAICEQAARSLERLFAKERLAAYAESLARFYEADLPAGATLDLHLMARPAHRSVDAASQIGGHTVVEIPEADPPESRAPIVVHELLHHLFAKANPEKLAGLARSFAEADDPLAKASYAVLDEALATALGTSAVMKRLDPDNFSKKNVSPMGLYAEPTIDRVAKAIRPLLEKTLEEKRTLYDPAFLKGYLAAIHAAYPQGMPPTAHARPLVAALDRRFMSAFQALDSAAMASSLGGATAAFSLDSKETIALFDGRKNACNAFFVTHDSVGKLDGHAEHIGKDALAHIHEEASHTPAFVYSTERSPGVYRFVFVADEPSAMERLVRALVHQNEPFEGTLEVKIPAPARR